ncbi:MAG: glycosyltransferase family 4 protein [Fischerella sp.]|nr:glycosyltransferase family 4 protein [Fischerella sp.]
MKVLHLSTYDIHGGAARATYRLHQGLQRIGVHSQMLVKEKFSDDAAVFAPKMKLFQGIARAKTTLDVLPLKFYRQRDDSTSFSPQWLLDRVISKVTQIQPDIINLHWLGSGFTQIETLAKLKRPLVWTLHDMWAFTGGCHYSGDCDRYIASCGSCPRLNSKQDWDLSRWIWRRKAKAWKNLDLTIVAPSAWLAQCASSSSLFNSLRIERIPNGLDTQIYKPIQQQVARELLGLPLDKKLILFGSLKATSEKRKGFYLLQPALQNLSQAGWVDKLEVMILGTSQPENPPEIGFKTHYLGTLNDDISIAIAYSAADTFVLPSTQDNLPNMIVEAIACGTPCVAFNIGGIPDIIEHQKNGYLVQSFDITDLVKGIIWVLENDERYQSLSFHAREKAEQEFSLEIQAKRYYDLFNEILSVH